MKFSNLSYLTSADALEQCPPDEGIEIAFVGRSNAGKSSAINTIFGNKKLARVSKTPGRTQMINFFSIDENHRIVDLPGYGFAKVSRNTQKHWGMLMEKFLSQRTCLKGLILIMDIRHPLRDTDLQLIEWANHVNIKIHILLTKADKLSRNQQNQTLFKVRSYIKNSSNVSCQTFSSFDKLGLESSKEILSEWFNEN